MDPSKSTGLSALGGAEALTDLVQAVRNILDTYGGTVAALLALPLFLTGDLGYGWLRALLVGGHHCDQGWMPLLVLALPVTLSFSSGGAVTSGQLRYAYLESTVLVEGLRGFVPGWSVRGVFVTLFWVPFPPLWILVSCAAAWQYAVFKYHGAVYDVDRKASKLCCRARAAVSLGRTHAAAIAKLEQHALSMARTAAHDARLARSVKVTDFFDQASQAWDCVHKTSQPYEALAQRAKDAHQHALEMKEAAQNDDDSDGDEDKDVMDNPFAEELVDSAKEALDAALDITRKLEIAKASITQSRDAASQASAARQAELDHANSVQSAVLELVMLTKGASPSLAAVVGSFEEAQRLANQAKAKAVGGELAQARDFLSTAKTEATKAVDETAVLATMESSARDILVRLQLGGQES